MSELDTSLSRLCAEKMIQQLLGHDCIDEISFSLDSYDQCRENLDFSPAMLVGIANESSTLEAEETENGEIKVKFLKGFRSEG